MKPAAPLIDRAQLQTNGNVAQAARLLWINPMNCGLVLSFRSLLIILNLQDEFTVQCVAATEGRSEVDLLESWEVWWSCHTRNEGIPSV